MKRMGVASVLFLVIFLVQCSFAQVPHLINYQGRLLSGTNLVNGTVGLSLRLVNTASGGTAQYEDSNTVAVVDGLYSTLIGDNTTAGSLTNALTNAAVYVEIAVNGTALSPRERLTSVAYTLNAASAAAFAGMIADSQLSTNVARLSVPNTSVQASGVPTVSFGFVVNATVTNGGFGYVTPPLVTVTDAGGTGANIIASISGSIVTGLAVQAPGSGYSTNAVLTIAPPPSNAYQTFGGVNFFTGVNTMINGSNTFAGSFAGNGAGLTNLNASQLANGTVADARLSTNVALLNGGAAFSGTVSAASFSGPGTLPWQVVSGTAQQAQANTGYLVTNNALVTVTLPVSLNLGDVVGISGNGAGGWQIAQNMNQSVVAKKIPGNGPKTWTPRDANRSWRAVASSEDGSKLVAGVYNGQLYTSADSGATWTPRETNRTWNSVASSADGSKLVAATFGQQLYTSTDSGSTWTARDTNRTWYSVASSADGTKLAAVVQSGQIYTSSDSGTNWTARESTRSWQAIASSSDGSKLAAVVAPGQIYTSSDSGTNWTARESSRTWYSVASSADGTKLVAAANGGQIYTSTDSGTSWTGRVITAAWYSVASSSDGTKLIAVVSGGQIYNSADSGVTWTARDSNRNWVATASSSDGSKLIAAVSGGQIYTSVIATTPGTTGYLAGDSGSAIQLQYVGNGLFIPISLVGSILAY